MCGREKIYSFHLVSVPAITVSEELTLIQQSQQIRLFLGKLIHRARFRCFVRSPPEQLRTVAEAIGGHVVKTYFDDELGMERLPGIFFSAIPATRPTGGVPSEPGWLDQPFELFGQSGSIGGGDAGGEADVMK